MSKKTSYFLTNTAIMLSTEGICLYLLWFGKNMPYYQGLLNLSYVTNTLALVAAVVFTVIAALVVFVHYDKSAGASDDLDWRRLSSKRPSRWVFRAVGLITYTSLAFAGWWYLFAMVFLTNLISTGAASILRRFARDIIEEEDPGIHKPT